WPSSRLRTPRVPDPPVRVRPTPRRYAVRGKYARASPEPPDLPAPSRRRGLQLGRTLRCPRCIAVGRTPEDAMELTGLHHVTAVTGRAPENLAFYTGLLGLRLVKKTVNQDDVSAYHLFYGDALGHPGTELTFFDWPLLAPRVLGTGTI